jgi:photosystem II stability/assembly factor-like uncharacterized protein
MKCIFLAAVVCLLPLTTQAQWIEQASGTTARLRGLSVVSERIAWVSGAVGTVLCTIDGGAVWKRRPILGADPLDFRDIEAFDERTAYALSIGKGQLSRIYKTEDGGNHWMLQFVNPDLEGFLDALAFWDAEHGLALGDPVDGHFVILTTDDGGKNWSRIALIGVPRSTTGEGAFAASGTCLGVQGERNAWFGTSGGRVFRSNDRGHNWTVQETPIHAGNGSSGIFSLVFWDSEHGAAIGGDYKQPENRVRTVALTSDGGRSWRLPESTGPGGFRSALLHLRGVDELIAVGPSGTDRSRDGGESWIKLGDMGFHAVGCAGRQTTWAVGEGGRICNYDVGRADPKP